MEITARLHPGRAGAARPVLAWLISALLVAACSLAPFLSDGAAAARPSTLATPGGDILGPASSGLLDADGDGNPDVSADLDVLTAGGAEDDGLRLRVPYRTQFDGSTFQWGNCGVAGPYNGDGG